MKSARWDKRFLKLAKEISSWSKDPSTKVGAVIVDDNNRIVSVGYNGFPQGIEDSEDMLLDRKQKYDIIIHAEMNAILFANKPLTGCALYTWPFQPCSKCAGVIIQSGIKRVVSMININNRWNENFAISKKLFTESKVCLELLNEL